MNWYDDVPDKIHMFVNNMQSSMVPGYYRYSYSGDHYDENSGWGLGNTVFAAKIHYMLGTLTDKHCREIGSFINSFQDDDGYIYDPVVQRLSRFARIAGALKRFDFNNVFNEQNKRAETRQAFAALRCIAISPKVPFRYVPGSKYEVDAYIEKLDWSQPWGAGSHVSHLLFFLRTNYDMFGCNRENWSELVDHVIKNVTMYRQADGSWYLTGTALPAYQKVNAAMKILTGFEAAGIQVIENPEALIDLCLSSINDGHACNNFNIIYVLYRCSMVSKHRNDEVRRFCQERLNIYRKHYWPEYGGFSFYERNANSTYYSACVSKGLSEPDIHGTVMFLWGITLISKMLNLGPDYNLQIPIT